MDEMKSKHPAINLHLFINPYHHSYWQVVDKSGHWGSYLQWKRDLADLGDNFPEYAIYDFSLPSEHTLEPLNYEQDKQLMTWYWEPAHYRPALGDEVLKVLLDETTTASSTNWPIRLQQRTIEKVIEQSVAGLAQSN